MDFKNYFRSKYSKLNHLRPVFENIGWLFGGKAIRITFGIFIYAWIARYLGPEQFGLLNLAIALVSISSIFSTLGLKVVVVRNLVSNPDNKYQTLGTSFILQFFGGIMAYILSVFAAKFLMPNSTLPVLLVSIIGASLIFKATESIVYWFESQTKSKYIVWIDISVFIFISLCKLVLILISAPLIAFAWAILIEIMVIALARFGVYIFLGNKINKWKIKLAYASNLVKESWPLFLSSGLVLLNMNIDKAMLGSLSSERELGLYSVCYVISGAWYFIPVAIGASFMPRLTLFYQENRNLYEGETIKLFRAMTYFALLGAIPVLFAANPIINVLFGEEYSGAGAILSIHIWTALFVFHVSIRKKLLVIERKQFLVMLLSASSLLTNIIANLILIPLADGVGAAFASLISWFFSVMIFPLFFYSSRKYPMSFLQTFIPKRISHA